MVLTYPYLPPYCILSDKGIRLGLRSLNLQGLDHGQRLLIDRTNGF